MANADSVRRNTPEKAPLALRIVAGLFVFHGFCSLIGIIFSIMRGHSNLDFTALEILIGLGLLKHSRGWRTLGLVFLWIGMIGYPLAALLLLLGVGKPTGTLHVFGIPISEMSRSAVLLFLVFIFLLTFWQYRVLTRPHVRRLFYGGEEGAQIDESSADVSSWLSLFRIPGT